MEKHHIINLGAFGRWMMIAMWNCCVFGASAASFTNLYNFQDTSAYGPKGLLPAGNYLYGVTAAGGSGMYGTVFRVNLDGSGYTNLHDFSAGDDGADPRGTLISSGNNLYGTTFSGGMNGGYGTVFKLNIDGSGFTNLHFFTNLDGANPQAGVVLCSNTLYGTTTGGDTTAAFHGAVFAVNTDGGGFTNLHFFNAPDGYPANAGLVLRSNVLYGSTSLGGDLDRGTFFKINTDGSGFTNFCMLDGDNGSSPYWPFTFVGDVLYGAMHDGGPYGIIFKINPDGTGLTKIFAFDGMNGSGPNGPLVTEGGTLYGTTMIGGTNDYGSVFRVNLDGSGFLSLHSFNGNDGHDPFAGLVLSSNIFYGTTLDGVNGEGTIFELVPPPNPIALNIHVAGGAPVLTWSDAEFSLQAASSVGGSYSNVLGATSPYTNSNASGRVFFRLRGN